MWSTSSVRAGTIPLYVINAGPWSARTISEEDFMPLGISRPDSHTGTWCPCCMLVQSSLGPLHTQTNCTGWFQRWKKLTLTNSAVEEKCLFYYSSPSLARLPHQPPFKMFHLFVFAPCWRSVPHQLFQQLLRIRISNPVTGQTLSLAYFSHVRSLLLHVHHVHQRKSCLRLWMLSVLYCAADEGDIMINQPQHYLTCLVLCRSFSFAIKAVTSLGFTRPPLVSGKNKSETCL